MFGALMKLIYYTPFYQNSDFMAHLTEHMILHPRSHDYDGQHFFMLHSLAGELRGEYMMISFDDTIDSDQIRTYLHQPLSAEMLEYEMGIFDEEFGDVSYTIRAFEKFYQSVYGKSWSGRQQEYTLPQIQEYHAQYVIQAPYVLADSESGICRYYGSSSMYSLRESALPNIQYHHLLLEGESNHYLVFPMTVEGIITARFFELLIDGFDTYHKRYRLGSYYTHSTRLQYTHDRAILRFGPHTKLPLHSQDYEHVVKMMPHAVTAHYRRYAQSIILLRHRFQIDDTEMTAYMQSISFEQVSEILKQARSQ